MMRMEAIIGLDGPSDFVFRIPKHMAMHFRGEGLNALCHCLRQLSELCVLTKQLQHLRRVPGRCKSYCLTVPRIRIRVRTVSRRLPGLRQQN